MEDQRISPPILITQQLAKHFPHKNGSAIAFQDVSFQVDPGEFVAIVGPSGCGKTTLLRIIAGLASASSGELQRAIPLAQLTMVFQEHGLYPWLTLSENIMLPLTSALRWNKAQARRRAVELLQRFGMADAADSYPQTVSGGMRQRASLARSFAVAPRLLLMDEPFVFLDYQTRLHLQQELLEIWRESNASVIFVTHDVEEAIALADRVLIFTGRPGQLHESLPIVLPRPRDTIAQRELPQFRQYVRHISHAIGLGQTTAVDTGAAA